MRWDRDHHLKRMSNWILMKSKIPIVLFNNHPRTRLFSTAGRLAEWPEYRCEKCGEFKPRMAFEGARYGKVPPTCKRCLKVSRKKQK